MIYGQSPFGLAKGLGISQEEAAKFIDGYFATYRGVADFMLRTLDECRRKGYVSTILGRRRAIQGVRPVDQLTLGTDQPSRRPLNLPERTAVNTVIQGSAADMIKLAMIAIDRRLRDEPLDAKMILQIHDELVFEVAPDEHRPPGQAGPRRNAIRAAAPRAAEGRREIGRQLGGVAKPWARMKTIGLVGGVASGKSLVAKMLVELGAGLLDADRAGHAVLAEDAEVQRGAARALGRRRLRRRWQRRSGGGRRACFRRGEGRGGRAPVSRSTCCIREFGSGWTRQRDQFAAEGRPAVVLDAPLLLEAGWGPMCDVVLMVDCPARSAARSGPGSGAGPRPNSPAAKPPNGRSRKNAGAADVVIPNDGTEDELRQAVDDFWRTACCGDQSDSLASGEHACAAAT